MDAIANRHVATENEHVQSGIQKRYPDLDTRPDEFFADAFVHIFCQTN
jgi:hypothetical protein